MSGPRTYTRGAEHALCNGANFSGRTKGSKYVTNSMKERGDIVRAALQRSFLHEDHGPESGSSGQSPQIVLTGMSAKFIMISSIGWLRGASRAL